MPLLTYSALQRALDTNPPGGAFYVGGEEEHMREQAVARIVAAHLDDATRDFNYDQLRGADAAPEALASLLATPPMMAEWRVVVLREAQALSPRARDVVTSVVAAPPPGLVFVVSAPGSKAKFYDELKKHARSVEFKALDAMDAPGWLIEAAKSEHGVEIEVDAARALVAGLGTQLGILSSELAKLAAYVRGRETITLADVRAVCGAVPRYDRWQWFDLIGERRFGEALQQLPVLLESGESGVALVMGMTTQLLRVALACAGGQGALEQALPGNQRWLARRITPQARRWTLAEADTALSELLRTERLLKSASLTERQAVEELLLRLAAIGERGATSAA
jgi:DNA polymerase-3 subunit delta